jgi:hypothetical protein
MRIHEGDFAYDLEPQRDPTTQLLRSWKYTVFRVRPAETLVSRGETQSREEAEAQAQKEIKRLLQGRSGRAA